MIIVLQRVERASVAVEGEEIARIGFGWLALMGVESGDTQADLDHLASKITKLRGFVGSNGKPDLSILEVKGEILLVSQFTLAGDCRKGNRPSFSGAEDPERARALVDAMAARLKAEGIPVHCGRFGAEMIVESANQGPFTLILRSPGATGN